MTVTAFATPHLDGLPRVPPDIDMANNIFGANCGPVSLAAAFGTFVYTLMRYFPEFPARDYTTAADMEYALKQCGARYSVGNEELPRVGVALVQLDGPWSSPGAPARAALCYTHWVACCGSYVFDLNIGDWLEREEWAANGINSWFNRVSRCTGWRLRRTWEITPQPFQFSPYGRVPVRPGRKAPPH